MLPLCPATTGASLCSDATPTARSCGSLSRRRGYRGRQCARSVCCAIGRPGDLFCEDPAQSRIRDVQVTGWAQSAGWRWTILRTPFRPLTRRGPAEAHFAGITTPELRRIGHRIVALCDLETGRRPRAGCTELAGQGALALVRGTLWWRAGRRLSLRTGVSAPRLTLGGETAAAPARPRRRRVAPGQGTQQ